METFAYILQFPPHRANNQGRSYIEALQAEAYTDFLRFQLQTYPNPIEA